jgi:hypothetical protein
LKPLVPRQQPFSQRVENRLLKESKARSCADPDNDRQTDENEASQFPSIFNPVRKDFFHSWIALSICYYAIAVLDFQVCEEIPESWKGAMAL